jgi:hypothetical protein
MKTRQSRASLAAANVDRQVLKFALKMVMAQVVNHDATRQCAGRAEIQIACLRSKAAHCRRSKSDLFQT